MRKNPHITSFNRVKPVENRSEVVAVTIEHLERGTQNVKRFRI